MAQRGEKGRIAKCDKGREDLTQRREGRKIFNTEAQWHRGVKKDESPSATRGEKINHRDMEGEAKIREGVALPYENAV